MLNLYIAYRQPGQTSTAEVAKRDLRAELLAAEAEAREKKRKAEGKPALTIESGNAAPVDDEANKRRKLLQEALEMDKDDDDDDEESESGAKKAEDKHSDEYVLGWHVASWYTNLVHSEEEDEDDDDDDEDDEDESAELLRELEKIKRERAEEKERLEQEQSASSAAEREAEIATANPLLNLAAALGQTPNGVNTTVPGTFAVKRRWDDGRPVCMHDSRSVIHISVLSTRFDFQEPGDEFKRQGQVRPIRQRLATNRVPQVCFYPVAMLAWRLIVYSRKFMAKFIKVLPVLLCSLSATDDNLSSNLLDIVFRIACTVVVYLSNSFDGRTVIHMIPSEKCLYYYSMAL